MLARLALALPVVMLANATMALDTTTGSYVDLAPILNPLIQGIGALLAAAVVPLTAYFINWIRKKSNLASIEVDAALQAKIDAAAQKIIGGAIARAQIDPGKVTIDVHSPLVAEAANKLATNFGETLTQLGSKDNAAKAVEIIENRIGMMKATREGTPVPNPSAPPPVVAVAPAVPVAAPNV